MFQSVRRGQLLLASAFLLLLTNAMAQEPGRTYTNPLTDRDAADPAIVRHEGFLYLYVTGRGPGGGSYPIYKTSETELGPWEWVANVFNSDTMPRWVQGRYYSWAPETHLVNGTYVCYFSTRAKDGKFAIGTATAKHPAGPFIAQPEPFAVDPKVGLIDASYFQDPQTSKSYVMYKEDRNDLTPQEPTGLIIVPVSDDGLTSTGVPKAILYNDQPWEGVLVESPSIMYRNGWYYLFFSGDVFSSTNYAVGVARSRNVMGPYKKNPANPILRSTARFDGPGHQFLFHLDNGEVLMYYHARDNDNKEDRRNPRYLMADPILWNKEAWPHFNNNQPSTTWTLTSNYPPSQPQKPTL